MSQRKYPTQIDRTFSKKRLAPLIFFLIFPPVGTAILIRDLLLESKASVYLSAVHQKTPVGSRTLVSETPVSSLSGDPLSIIKQKKKNVLVWGAFLTVLFGLSAVSTVLSNKSPDVLLLLIDVVSAFGGLFLLYLSLGLNRKIHLFRKYLAAMGTNHTISVSALASAVNHSPQQTQQTLLDMLNEGCFPYGLLNSSDDIRIRP